MSERNGDGIARVMIVEDNPGDILLMQEAFENAGAACSLSFARDGALALAILKRTGPHAGMPLPDLILLDLNLPKVNGHEFVRDLKQDPQLRRIPVLVISSSKAERDIANSYD